MLSQSQAMTAILDFENTSDLMCSSKKCPGQPEVRAAIFETSS